MKIKQLLSISMIIIINFILALNCFAQLNPKDNFDFPELNKIKKPEVHKIVLSNGMKIYFVEDQDYPTISMRGMLHTGSIYEPENKIGLAYITGSVMRTGGSKKYPGDKLDNLLETLGADISTGIGSSSGYISLSVFKEDIDQCIDILADILINPLFPEEKIDLAKIELRAGISRRNDDVGQITSREFSKLIYGEDSPYARHTEYSTVKAITKEDLVSFHRKYFHPNNISFAVWGDFNWKELKKKLEKTFTSWKPAKFNIPKKSEINYKFNYSVNYIEKTDIDQSNIMLGHIGGKLNNPDYPALTVMNQILSFERMFKRIRTNEGLAYSVGGSYGASYDHCGVFGANCQTKSESTVKAIQLMLEEINKIKKDKVTDEELKRAKDSFLNGFVFNFDSKSKILNRFLTYDFYKYPADFMDKIKQGVESVSKDDVLRVAEKYLKPDSVRILVVGNHKNFDKPLSVLGKVNTIDITIPSPEEKTVEATVEAISKGTALIEKVIKASGGLNSFKNVKNTKTSVDITQVTPMGEMKLSGEFIVLYPDKMKILLDTPGGSITIILNGDKAWMVIPGRGTAPLPGGQRNEYQENFLRDPVQLFSNYKNYQFQYLGTVKFAEKNAEELLITKGDYSFHFFIDQKTFLPLGYNFTQMSPQGPVKTEERVSEYKKTNNLLLPMKIESYQLGKKVSEAIRKEREINTEIDEKIFEKK